MGPLVAELDAEGGQLLGDLEVGQRLGDRDIGGAAIVLTPDADRVDGADSRDDDVDNRSEIRATSCVPATTVTGGRAAAAPPQCGPCLRLCCA